MDVKKIEDVIKEIETVMPNSDQDGGYIKALANMKRVNPSKFAQYLARLKSEEPIHNAIGALSWFTALIAVLVLLFSVDNTVTEPSGTSRAIMIVIFAIAVLLWLFHIYYMMFPYRGIKIDFGGEKHNKQLTKHKYILQLMEQVDALDEAGLIKLLQPETNS